MLLLSKRRKWALPAVRTRLPLPGSPHARRPGRAAPPPSSPPPTGQPTSWGLASSFQFLPGLFRGYFSPILCIWAEMGLPPGSPLGTPHPASRRWGQVRLMSLSSSSPKALLASGCPGRFAHLHLRCREQRVGGAGEGQRQVYSHPPSIHPHPPTRSACS